MITVYDSQGRPKTSATGESEFIELTDTPSSYSGEDGKVVAVKNTEDGLEFVIQSGAGSVDEFTDLTDTPSDYSDQSGKYTIVNEAEDGLEFAVGTGSGGGASDLLDLTDTPSSYSGASGKSLVVNDEEDAVEFVAISGAGGDGYTEGARVYNDADISMPNDSPTAITFNTERYDTNTIHDIGSNTGRLTCQTAGKYIIIGNGAYDGSNAGLVRELQIVLNGSTIIGSSRLTTPSTTAEIICVSTIYDLSESDYVELKAYHNKGTALDIKAYPNYSPEFMMQRIGT